MERVLGNGRISRKGWKGKGKGKPAIEPPASAPSVGQSKAEAKLQEIVTVLKKKDDPEWQTLATEADIL